MFYGRTRRGDPSELSVFVEEGSARPVASGTWRVHTREGDKGWIGTTMGEGEGLQNAEPSS